MIRLKSLLFEYDLQTTGELEKAIAIVKGLQARGFSFKGAVALTGNIAHESGCEPDQNEDGGTGAFGLCQWDPGAGRLKALREFAKMVGKPVGSLETQLDFMKCELIDGYMWNGKPVPNINKDLIYIRQLDGSYEGLSNFYVKRYNKAIAAGDLSAVTTALESKIFSPQPGSTEKRVANAKKIHEAMTSGKPTLAATQTKKADTTTSNVVKYKASPNPVAPGNSLTVTVDQSILPLTTVDLAMYSSTGTVVPNSKHHWDNVSKGVLKFTAPEETGIFFIKINTGSSKTSGDVKIMVK